MTFPSQTKNNWLNGQPFDTASLHTDFPGATGANEVTGGTPAYARKVIVVDSSAGGTRLLNAAETFNVPACTVKWVGMWDAATYVLCAPNGGATPKNFMAVPSSDLVWSTGHGWRDGQKIVFYDGTPPTPLVEGKTYFARDSTADNFKVAATLAGVAIDLTTASSFGCVVCAITEEVYPTQDTHTLSTATVTVPD